MSTVSAVGSALQGIHTGLRNLDRDAAKIASAEQFNNESGTDVAKSLTDIAQDRLQVQVSAKVLKAADETVGTMLDVFA